MKFSITSVSAAAALAFAGIGYAFAAGMGGMQMDDGSMHHGHSDGMQMEDHCGSAMGSMAMDNAQDQPMQKAAASTAYEARGVVVAVDAAGGKVTIEHEPIAALNWPAMTMRFTSRDAKMLEGLKAGDKVKFTFVQEGRLSVLESISR